MFTFRPTLTEFKIEKIFSKFQNCLVIGNIYIVVFFEFCKYVLVPPELFHLLFVKFVFSINSAVISVPCRRRVGGFGESVWGHFY